MSTLGTLLRACALSLLALGVLGQETPQACDPFGPRKQCGELRELERRRPRRPPAAAASGTARWLEAITAAVAGSSPPARRHCAA